MIRTHLRCVSRAVLSILLWCAVGTTVALADDGAGYAPPDVEVLAMLIAAVIANLAGQRYLPSKVDLSSVDARFDALERRLDALEHPCARDRDPR